MQKKILVVDDSEINRELLVEILKNDYAAETAEDGEQAVSRINELGENLAAILLDLQMQAAKLKASNEKIIEILGTVVEYRNLESGEHIRRIKSFTRILAGQVMQDYPEYGLTEKKVDMIVQVSSLYDVGKIAISDRILLKPGRLTSEEFEYMKSHTTRGYDMLNHIKGIWEDDSQKICSEICRHHHERYDGKGYPDGLKGEEIPISAQIVAVADVYDALVTERVYKDAFPKDKAFHMIINGECGMFSPKIMECFRKVRSEFEKTVEEIR